MPIRQHLAASAEGVAVALTEISHFAIAIGFYFLAHFDGFATPAEVVEYLAKAQPAVGQMLFVERLYCQGQVSSRASFDVKVHGGELESHVYGLGADEVSRSLSVFANVFMVVLLGFLLVFYTVFDNVKFILKFI